MRVRLPLSRRLFSSTYCTERSRPIWSRRSSLCLYPMTDVRAITPNRSGSSLASWEIVSSVRPSARYSLLGSPVRFSNGNTASMTFCDLGGIIARKYLQDVKPTITKRTADAPTTAAFRQRFSSFGTARSTGLRTAGCVAASEPSAMDVVLEFVRTAKLRDSELPISDGTEHLEARTTRQSAVEELELLREQLYRENLALRDEVDRVSMFEEIVGTSPALEAVLSRAIKVAPSDSTVLITGETGTGKELVARAIHRRSDRVSHPFVGVNCAAIPRDLIASELFGHEKGAFTGATQQRLGRFEL